MSAVTMTRSLPSSTRARRLLGPIAALLCSLSIALPGRAQQPPPKPALDPNSAEAEVQFLAGREAMKKGDLPLAAQLFRRSQELHPAAGTLLNLANVEERIGRLATALDLFQTALTQLGDGDDRIQIAKDGIARLAPRVPSLKIERVAGAPPATRIAVDDAPIAASGVGADQPMNPGTYRLLVTAPGHEPRSYEVKLGEGQHTALAVEPGKPVAALAAAQAPAPRSGTARTLGFALGGVGVAGLGIGAVTGILAIVKKGQLDTTCPDSTKCSAEGLRLEGGGKALAGVSTAALIVGVVGVGAGLTLVLVNRDHPSAAAPSAPALALGSGVLPGGGWLGARGAF
jgi:hypothetical protein